MALPLKRGPCFGSFSALRVSTDSGRIHSMGLTITGLLLPGDSFNIWGRMGRKEGPALCPASFASIRKVMSSLRPLVPGPILCPWSLANPSTYPFNQGGWVQGKRKPEALIKALKHKSFAKAPLRNFRTWLLFCQTPGVRPINIWELRVLGSEQQCFPKAEPHQLAHPELPLFWYLWDRVLTLSLLI